MPNSTPSFFACLVFLGVTVFVYLALVGGAQLLRRTRGVRFGGTYHAFAAAAGMAIGVSFVPWESSWRAPLLQHLEAATLLLAVFPFAVLLNRVVWGRPESEGQGDKAPRLLADATRLVLLLVVVLVILQFFYGVKVPGLVAGSGVAAIILGLAMQDLLGNILAGLALHWAKTFKTGDWLLVDGYHARVVELTSRSTRLLTQDEVIVDVPNSDLVKRAVVNFSQPNPRHAVRATLRLDYDVPPARARAILLATASAVPGVCSEPPPLVIVKELTDLTVVYEIKVWIEDHALQGNILSDVLTHSWYALRRAGLESPFPPVMPRSRLVTLGEEALAAAAAAMRVHAIFGFLTSEQIEALVHHCRVVLFAPAQRLVTQDASADSMFLLVSGTVEVQVERAGRVSVVTRLGPGDCLGEMSLLTGEPRTATVVACEEVEAVEITKAAFATLVRGNPEVLARLSELLTQRQLANQAVTATEQVELPENTRASVLRRLRSFFNLGN